jgi:uncharacterized protein (DUF1810 family)
MKKAAEITSIDDPFNLRRFTEAQEKVYDTVLNELKNGEKQTHWMWYIFPQLDGLARSPTASFYVIKSREEARQYLRHPLLGARLLRCTKAVLDIDDRSLADIFGFPDELKFKSSMTLFAAVSAIDSVFAQALDKFCHGERDEKTIMLLENGG